MSQKLIHYQKKIAQSLLLSTFIFFASTLWAQDSKLYIVTEEWAPYNYTEDDVLKGVSVEIVQNIISEIKANAQINIFPSMRASRMLNSGNRMMLITMMRTPEREEKYNWIGPLGDAAIYFYKKKGNPIVISTLEEAKKVPLIACRHAGLVFNVLKAAGFTNLDSSATDGISIYKKLLHGRCDLGISDVPLGVRYILKQMDYPVDALVQTSVKVVEAQLYIACSRDIPISEIAIWQKALDKMKASGVYDKIYMKYSD